MTPERDETAPANARRTRPTTEKSYGIPDDATDLLPWAYVEERLTTDRTFWVSTTLPDGRPHARPVWGVLVDGTFHCGGGPRTRWVRNLERDPAIAVHGESGEEVVIVEGGAERTDDTADPDPIERVDDAYEKKYGVRHGPGFAVRPRTVLAWRDYPHDATRWEFETEAA